MGGKSSLDKGKRGEREVVAMLQPIVDKVYAEFEGMVDARTGHVIRGVRLQRNTLQSDAGGFDIVGLEWLALEVKYQETLNVEAWWRQTCGQAKEGQLPVLLYRKSRVEWKAMTMSRVNAGTKIVRLRTESRGADWLVVFEALLRWELKKRVTV